ncbi:MAG: hypothetical protein E7500_00900 [Ruminococcus sp.]|nr:hypothetical protein [Ruminococcus sp.]
MNVCKKIASVLEYIIGIALLICLFVGGLGFFGYMAAFIIGGDTAAEMCTWLKEEFYANLIKLSTYTTLASFLLIYLRGEANWVNPIKYWGGKLKKENKAENK